MICRQTKSRACAALMLIALVAPWNLSPSAAAQKKPATPKAITPSGEKAFALTIDNIMRGFELVGYEPRAVRWSQDGQRVYFQWKQSTEPREKEFDTYTVNRDGSG
ncbi:MAG TPA: hypothetical protein VFB82_02245, partial [Blastocatellia bacterium]|nr:hypothetical protein [Blastocatellia bacterium]